MSEKSATNVELNNHMFESAEDNGGSEVSKYQTKIQPFRQKGAEGTLSKKSKAPWLTREELKVTSLILVVGENKS